MTPTREKTNVLTFTVPGQFKNVMNLRENRHAFAARVNRTRASVSACMLLDCGAYWHERLAPPPYVVTFTRLSPRVTMDDDGLRGACKTLRDQVARELGLNDSPTSPIEWRYAQRKGDFAVEVRIESVAASAAVAR